MINSRNKRQRAIANPRITLRTRAEKAMMSPMAISPSTISGQVACVKWLTANEIEVIPEDFAPTPLSMPSTCGTIASAYGYDHGEEAEITLRSNVDDVSGALRQELHERLAKAGVVVEEARLTHLAYAPEIAQAMLRRQQAEAVIAARQKIVHGAVSMVEMALKELSEKNVLTMDDDRKAAMVSNLMVVLCGESEVHPVVNTGTLYT